MKLLTLLFLLSPFMLMAQETSFTSGAIKAGMGIGYAEGIEESGMGFVYSIGWQKAIDKQQRLHINPSVLFGGFTSRIITDVRDQYIRSSSFGCNLQYDVLKGKVLSLFAMGGLYGNYTRGLLGDGEFSDSSEYYDKFYAGGRVSFGMRVDNPEKRVNYEFRPLTFQFGNNSHFIGYMLFSVGIKFKK